jgi:hypothetical protein
MQQKQVTQMSALPYPDGFHRNLLSRKNQSYHDHVSSVFSEKRNEKQEDKREDLCWFAHFPNNLSNDRLFGRLPVKADKKTNALLFVCYFFLPREQTIVCLLICLEHEAMEETGVCLLTCFARSQVLRLLSKSENNTSSCQRTDVQHAFIVPHFRHLFFLSAVVVLGLVRIPKFKIT